MKRKITFLLAVIMLLGTLSGCHAGEPSATSPAAAAAGKETEPAGDSALGDVPGGTGAVDAAAVAARVGDRSLTNGQLQAWYWAEAGAYREGGQEPQPDFTQPLDRQTCPLDNSGASWQEYFLNRALNAWHSAQALVLKSENDTLEFHPGFAPNPKTHRDNTAGKPAVKFLYGGNDKYQLNTMHEAYLNSLPQVLEALAEEKGFADAADMAVKAFGTSLEDLEAYASLYNQGYMYLTFLGYDLVPEDEEVLAWLEEHKSDYAGETGTRVDIRHILASSQQEAQDLLSGWKRDFKANEASFAELAVRNSKDTGTALDGGAYHGLKKGQLPKEMEQWCFDAARQPGDTEIFETAQGVHILYFSRSTEAGFVRAKKDLTAHMQAEVLKAARQEYPMEAERSAIGLVQADAQVGAGDILYPDVAHERFPEAPVYLQQDFPRTMYGSFPVRSHGCGITTMSMLATYMTDTPLILPIMCERYGHYCHSNGTDGMIFIKEPREMGFYFKERLFEPDDALEALKEGYPVVCIQHKGYWTSGGHYLLLEEITESGKIRVRDSNIANYGKLDGHKVDEFDWKYIPPACFGYWVFEKKITKIPACIRCGENGEQTGMLVQDYLCDKCERGLLRRNTYMNACGL